ncbi:metal-dependent hydrolase [Mycobacteroides salmoniphilum]|uniref:Metal-dependent hydrolase n=1 Tax=Mycobacteroides salmoniphilum TaxID=404941 RepID=A0A4R8SAJ3_9MYCO|nr:metal-dependent hydrolase [Mycobacteroides salmoniphilum]TDZ91472.1 putative metal-dependent hydrolase [Mycobacteroides salmoniphilum]TEA00902.1 putative metal-dependent hydrolase [Mycobacteroides salmoniphilum]
MVTANADATARRAVAANVYPKVRRAYFRYVPFKKHFMDGDIVMSHFVALLSGVIVSGEEMVIRSVRRYSAQIDDQQLKKRVAGLVGQEIVHSNEHVRLNELVADKGYPITKVLNLYPDHFSKPLGKLQERLPGHPYLAVSVAIEHTTALLAENVLRYVANVDDEQRGLPGDPEVWKMLYWHAFEEIEHKSVAIDLYRATGGPEWLRQAIAYLFYVGVAPYIAATISISILLDPTAWKPQKVAREFYSFFTGPIFKAFAGNLKLAAKRDFHPDSHDTSELLEEWRPALFGNEGIIADRIK